MQQILGTVRIQNGAAPTKGGGTTVNARNQADAVKRTVTLEPSSGGYVTVDKLAPGKIQVPDASTVALNIWAGPAGNTFYVLTTPLGAGSALTNIHMGAGDDWMNVYGTKGSLKVDGQAGTNLFSVGSGDAGLDNIDGAVDLSGVGGINSLDVYDGAATTGHNYNLNTNLVHRTDKEMIFHQGMSSLSLSGGFYFDQFTVKNTGQPTTIYANNSGFDGYHDSVSVERTTAPLTLDLIGWGSSIDVGNADSSLDNILGKISIFPGVANTTTLTLHDEATTGRRDLTMSGTTTGQKYDRAVGSSGNWSTLVEVLGVPVKNFGYWSSSGGSTVFIDSTSAGTQSNLSGHAGVLDTFLPGWAATMNAIQGSIFIAGQAADNDYAFYYDYLNPTPQAYTIKTNEFLPSVLDFSRPGNAVVSYFGMAQVVFYAPIVGGNDINVKSVPLGTFLNMAVGEDDVTVGSDAPGLNGTLAGILGPVGVGAYAKPGGALSDVKLVVDNSQNLMTGYQGVSLTKKQGQFDFGHHIIGFAPATISWNAGANSTVDLRAGAADEFITVANGLQTQIKIDGGATGQSILQSEGGVATTFTFTGHNAGKLYDNVSFTTIQSFYGTNADDTFVFHQGAAIDGGIDGFEGTNTLDYSEYGAGVYVNLLQNVGTGAGAGIFRIRNVIGSSSHDILAGNGGNVLTGGAGRDLLIAGATASQLIGGEGEDILIGGTTVNDLNEANLNAVRDIWTSGDEYDTRVANLKSGLLNADSVFGNGQKNTLLGQGGRDFFFLSELDDDDMQGNEAFVQL